MNHRLRLAALPVVLGLAACTTDAPVTATAPQPQEQFRGVCQQRLPNATPFGLENCMLQELDRSRGAATPAATPASAGGASDAAPAARTSAPRAPAATRRRAR